MGHLEVLKALVSKDPSIVFRTDKKGQTALHMAVKGQNVEIVHALLKPDPSVMSLEDNKGNTALHIATRKGRSQVFTSAIDYLHSDGQRDMFCFLYPAEYFVILHIEASFVQCLLSVEGIKMNATNKAGETPLDIAEKFGTQEIASILREAGATNSADHGKPPNAAKQLKQTVSDIKHDVQSQLQQTRQTGVRVQHIAKRLKKLHISGLNNAINSATVVAVLIATVAFAAIFTVPGQYVEVPTKGASLGQAHIARTAAFLIFFVFDSLALFISLAVVVVQTSVVVIEQKAKKQLVFVINKLMWMACLFISIAFISLTYVVVGSHARIAEAKKRNIRKAESRSRSFSVSMASESELLNSEYRRIHSIIKTQAEASSPADYEEMKQVVTSAIQMRSIQRIHPIICSAY
ncbi:Ankyrin repeat-containing protein [Vitis vinifera]|uniref:Ankyrin repeat-containing protein n=1 Tax=Vitis vinifera TaxID=29760 RepID=A0A438GDB3_VITVI|nr:Ankyrin repeat-containing protein [Vitis vinifera]